MEFPINPIQGQEYTVSNKVWVFNGKGWALKSTTVSYSNLDEKPSINSVELVGNKTAIELGLAKQSAETVYDPSIYGSAIADVHLAAFASIANAAHSTDNADNAIRATYANKDSKGNQIDTHYATQSELQSVEDGLNAALDLKAMQNPGICQKCPILPADIVINPTANTLTIATVKGGQAISAGNPIRFYTDGSGIITKHEKTAPVVFNFTNTNGVWYFHFDNTGNPVATQTPWADFNVVATVYRFYLNDQLASADKITVRAWECHLNDTSAADHAWKHAQGTQYISGFDNSYNILTIANGVPTTAPNADGRNTVVAMTGGRNTDDGLEYSVVNSTAVAKFNQDLGQTLAASLNATNSALFKIRTNDAAGRLSFLSATRFPFAWDVATNAPQFITSAGVRTLVPDNNWFVYYSYALQDDVQGEAIKLVSAETAFTTWTAAKDHTWKALQNLYATLKDKEIRLLYKYIFYCDKTGGQAFPVGCKYSGLVLIEDQRTQLLTFTTSGGSTGTVIASNVTETTDGNVQAAIDGLRSSIAAGPANNSITNAILSQVPTATLKGRASLGTGNVEDLTPAQVIAMLNITPAKELVISKSTFNSIAEPGIYKNNATAKNITGHRLTTNATDFSITVAGTTYTNTATYPIALPANAELIINDVTIQTGYNIGNVILIIE